MEQLPMDLPVVDMNVLQAPHSRDSRPEDAQQLFHPSPGQICSAFELVKNQLGKYPSGLFCARLGSSAQSPNAATLTMDP